MSDPNIRNFSKILDIYLPLHDYTFDHGPSSSDEIHKRFIGREEVKRKLKLLLQPSDDKERKKADHGAYLVTGYRGMGKTSLVRQVIAEINKGTDEYEGKDTGKDNRKLKHFEFALSQDEVKDIDLLRQVAWQISDFVDDKIKPELENSLIQKVFKIISYAFANLTSVFLTLFVYNTQFISTWDKCPSMEQIFQNPFIGTQDTGQGYLIFFGILIGFIILFNRLLYVGYKQKRKKKNEQPENKILEKSNQLKNRLYST